MPPAVRWKRRRRGDSLDGAGGGRGQRAQPHLGAADLAGPTRERVVTAA
jgi:hypothetical protein